MLPLEKEKLSAYTSFLQVNLLQPLFQISGLWFSRLRLKERTSRSWQTEQMELQGLAGRLHWLIFLPFWQRPSYI
jgi:hypothetical protein